MAGHVPGHDDTVRLGAGDLLQQPFIVPAIDCAMEIGQMGDPKAFEGFRELFGGDRIMKCLEHGGTHPFLVHFSERIWIRSCFGVRSIIMADGPKCKGCYP